MSRDIRALLDDSAAAPRRPLDVKALVQPPRPHLAERTLAGALAIAALVGGVALVRAERELPANLVSAPQAPGVAYQRLADGTRVYVVRHDDGTVTVLDAVSTHHSEGLSKQVGWCASARGFEDPVHNSRWDERGRYVFGPASADLPYYRIEPHGGGFVVGERVAPAKRGFGQVRGAFCDERSLVLWDGPVGGADTTYASVADLPDGRLGRVADAELFVERSGERRLCDGDGAPCLALPAAAGAVQRPYAVRGVFVARRVGARLAEAVGAAPEVSRAYVWRATYVDERTLEVVAAELLYGRTARTEVADPAVVVLRRLPGTRPVRVTLPDRASYVLMDRLVDLRGFRANIRAHGFSLLELDLEPDGRTVRRAEIMPFDRGRLVEAG